MGFPFCLVTMEPLFFDADNWPLRSPKDASELILPAVGVKLEVSVVQRQITVSEDGAI